MVDFRLVVVPRQTVSDDRYRVVGLKDGFGEAVTAESCVAVLESSKAAFEVECGREGFFFANPRWTVGAEVKVGDVLGLIAQERDFRPSEGDFGLPDAGTESESVPLGASRISATAMALIAEHGLEPEAFGHLPFVRAADVLDYLKASSAPTVLVPQSYEPAGPYEKGVIVIGAGGHAKQCIDALRAMDGFWIAGIFASNIHSAEIYDAVPLLGRDDDAVLEEAFRSLAPNAVLGVGGLAGPATRVALWKRLQRIGFHQPNLIHRTAHVEGTARLGTGNQIMMGALVGSSVEIADNCIVNSGAIVSHDCRIDDHVHIAPGAILAGQVEVGEGALIGMGVTVYANVKVGARVVVPNGSRVFADIPDDTVFKG